MFSRFALGIGYLIFLLAVGLIVLGVHFMGATVPAYTGTATVSGISGTVDIERDQYAVPHIHAATEHDAYFGLGYAEAQDRLFQMELERRLGAGRMSELFGVQSLPLDRWARTVGFARIAAQMWRMCGPHTRDVLTAFCDGINAYLRDHRKHLGFEFDALTLVPQNWKPTDCLMIGRLMAWEMNFSALTDAAFGDFSLALDSAHLHALFPVYPANGATVLGGADPRMFVSNYLAVSTGFPVPAPKREGPSGNSAAPSAAQTVPRTAPAAMPHKNAPNPPAAKPGNTRTTKPPIKPPQPRIPKPPARIGAIPIQHAAFAQLLRAASAFDSAIGAYIGGGSNSFVVAPSRTASGSALLENDTHLQLGTPSRWYMAHLTSDDGMNVAGFLIPGLPAIFSGRTPDLAWGITSGMADECDYFVEKLDSTRTKYILPNGTAKAFQFIQDTIFVRDTVRASDNSTYDPLRPVPIAIALTVNGPVMTGMHPDSLVRAFKADPRAGGIPVNSIFSRSQQPVAMMWNGSYVLTDELAGWLELPHAKSVTQARNAMSGFATPCLNLCLADKAGNIAYQYIGRLPRRAGSDERLLLPRDGSNPADAWQGFIYMHELPGMLNPARGYIASANNPPGGPPIAYGLDWEPDSRADRLNELLSASPTKIDITEAQGFQTDIISPYDVHRVLPYLLELYPNPHPPSIAPDSTAAFQLDSMHLFWKEDSLRRYTTITDSAFAVVKLQDAQWLAAHRPQEELGLPIPPGDSGVMVPVPDPFTKLVLTYLQNWDGGMRADEIAPTIYSVFLNRLIFNTFFEALGPERYAEFIYLNNIPLETLANILPDTASIWWQQIPRDSIIQLSFRQSLRILGSSLGPDIRRWQWGRLHTLTFQHPFDKAGKMIARLVDIPAGPMSGGPTTVLQGTYYLWNPYAMQIGPSMRMVTDMKDPVLYGVLPTGNSEAIFGDHYKDMLPLYQSGALIRIPLDETSNPAWQRFVLKPSAEF